MCFVAAIAPPLLHPLDSAWFVFDEMNILGLSAYYYGSAACLLKHGEIVAAAQEKRFTRKKHASPFQRNATTYSQHAGNITPANVDYVVFYDKLFVTLERLLEMYLAFTSRRLKSFSESMPPWLKDKLFQKATVVSELRETLIKDVDWNERLRLSEHHLGHEASAFDPSPPFNEAAILTMNGAGETTTSFGPAVLRIQVPHRLQGELGRVQANGCGFLRRAQARQLDQGSPDPHQGTRQPSSNIDCFDYCTGLTIPPGDALSP